MAAYEPQMKVFQIGNQRFLCDPEATRRVYKVISAGDQERCGCAHCRNFFAARARGEVYSADFVTFLERLGIDHACEAEVYEIARSAPGQHHYGGWFHFVGSLQGDAPDSRPVEDDFSDLDLSSVDGGHVLCVLSNAALVREAFGSDPVVQLEFEVEVPWVLDAPEPE